MIVNILNRSLHLNNLTTLVIHASMKVVTFKKSLTHVSGLYFIFSAMIATFTARMNRQRLFIYFHPPTEVRLTLFQSTT